MLICLATSERPPISDFLFRVGRELESVGPAKLFDRFGGIFPGKTWGKHLLQRPPTGARFRQLRLFPYHLKSLAPKSVRVRVPPAAPRRKKPAPFRFRGFRKSRENCISAGSFLLLPIEARFDGVPVLSLRTAQKTRFRKNRVFCHTKTPRKVWVVRKRLKR